MVIDWPNFSNTTIEAITTRKTKLVDKIPDFLPDLEKLIDILKYGCRDDQDIQLVHEDGRSQPDIFDSQNNIKQRVVLESLYLGSTIVLKRLHRRNRLLDELCVQFRQLTGLECGVNAYITPPGQQGFEPHYDDHDVFIWQVKGTKDWTVWTTPVDAPSRALFLQDISTSLKGSMENIRLETGNGLYIPAGRVHAAKSTSEISVHYTFGVHFSRMFERISFNLLNKAKCEEVLRRPLIPGLIDQDANALDKLMCEVVRDSISANTTTADDCFRLGIEDFRHLEYCSQEIKGYAFNLPKDSIMDAIGELNLPIRERASLEKLQSKKLWNYNDFLPNQTDSERRYCFQIMLANRIINIRTQDSV